MISKKHLNSIKSRLINLLKKGSIAKVVDPFFCGWQIRLKTVISQNLFWMPGEIDVLLMQRENEN